MSLKKITYFSFFPICSLYFCLLPAEGSFCVHSNTVKDVCVGLKAATKLLSLTKTSCAAFQNKTGEEKKQCSKQNHAGEEGKGRRGEEMRGGEKDGELVSRSKAVREGRLESVLHSELFIHQHNLQSFEERRDMQAFHPEMFARYCTAL